METDQKENLKIDETEEKSNKKEKNKEKNKITDVTVNKIFYNVLLAILFMIYFFVLNIGYGAIMVQRLEKDIQLFAGVFLIIGLIFLEKSYKKDDGQKAITAIEFLVMSIHSLSIMHVVTRYKFDFQIYLTASSYIFAIYYILKSIIIYTKGRKKYLDDLSDVKDIVKKDEPIKKEAKKKRNQNDLERRNSKESEVKKKEKGVEKKKTGKKTMNKKSTGKKTTEKKATVKDETEKKSTGKKAIERKTTENNGMEKKPTGKKTTKRESTVKNGATDKAKMQKKKIIKESKEEETDVAKKLEHQKQKLKKR